MSDTDLGERIAKVVAKVFGVTPESVNDDCGADTIERWDSVTHINLVLAIESEFGLSLSPEEAMDMLSVKLIGLILEEKEL